MEDSGRRNPPDDAASRTPDDTSGFDPGTQYIPLAGQSTIPPRPAGENPVLSERFGRYRVIRCLGEGAMGAVYLADDTQLDRPIALKIPKFSQHGDSELIERFYREARAAATLRHANLCPVYDAGEIDGVHYLSMAYIEGRLLSEILTERGRPSVREATEIVLKLAKALAAAHGAGVIHRDLKPANIMIDPHNEPIVMDFGLARRMNKEDSRLTLSGLVMGSPAYMSPEQVEGDAEKMGPCCDIYSLGIIFYELLTGAVPFRGSIAAVMGQILTVQPKPPSEINREVDDTLEAICLTMIAKAPEDRFLSMAEVASAIDSYTVGRPLDISPPPRRKEAPSPPRPPDDMRGVLLSPWMVWTAVAVIVLGFGVTWKMIALTLQQQSVGEEIKLDAKTTQAIQQGETKVLLNGRQLTADQLNRPVDLESGANNVEIVDAAGVKKTKEIQSEADDPKVLSVSNDGVSFKHRRSRLVEWVVANGGLVKIDGVDKPIDRPEGIPDRKFQIEEIDLHGIAAVPARQLDSIRRTRSLKRLNVRGVKLTSAELEKLCADLKDCQIDS